MKTDEEREADRITMECYRACMEATRVPLIGVIAMAAGVVFLVSVLAMFVLERL